MKPELEVIPDGEQGEKPGFTPGPWSLTNDGTYIRPDCLKGTKPLVNDGLDVESWPAICDVRSWPQDRWTCLGPEESLANARLIAAAPALYEALHGLLKVARLSTWAHIDNAPCECKDCAIANATAALALVDGPQNQETSDG